MNGMAPISFSTYTISVGDIVRGKDIAGVLRVGRVTLATNHNLVVDDTFTIPRERAERI